MLVRALAALGLALLVTPGSAAALTPKQAERIAAAKLHPPAGAVLHTLKLKPGAVVSEAGPGPQSRVTRRAGRVVVRPKLKPVKRRAWLVWEDLVPGALFEHPSVAVLVDDRTRRVIGRQDMSFAPLINGRPLLKAAVAHAAAAPPSLGADCLVMIGDRADPLFAGDFTLADQVARELKLAKYDARAVADLDAQITKAQVRGCKDVMLVIAAHGYPAKGSGYKHPGSGEAIPESEHAQVAIGYKGTDDGEVHGEDLDAEMVRRLMNRFPALSFKLVISSCFSGRWLELNDVPNLRVIAVSSRRDQFSLGYEGAGEFQRATQTDARPTPANGTLTNTTTNHTRATEFLNGMLRGLDAWAHNEGRASDDLAKGIVDAFAHERDQDFAAQRGMTNPQLSDHTGTGPAPTPMVTPTPAPQVNVGPAVSLNVSATTAKAGRPVHFQASASDTDGRITGFRLDFGDGTADDEHEAADGEETDHTYPVPGVYAARFSATDDDGATTVTDPVTIYVGGAGTKDALLDDAPCPGDFDAEARIDIPSYADQPTATFTGLPCVGSTVTITDQRVEGTDPAELDAWARPKLVYYVKLHVVGGTATRSTLTVTAHWN